MTAAVNTSDCENAEGNIGSLVQSICPTVRTAQKTGLTGAARVEEAVNENVHLVAERIEAYSPIVKAAVEAGHVKIVKARYDLDSGKVSLMGGHE